MRDDTLDMQLLFEESPDVLLVLLPDAPRYTMVAATEARLRATHTTREQIIGLGLFDVFPDNPDDPSATGTAKLRASLERVLATRAPDTMAVQKYDVGIPEGELTRIFERFHRVAGAGGRRQEETGIGLSLVRELVELHGGQVSVESEVGRGTTFRVTLRRGFDHLPQEAVSRQPIESGPRRATTAHVAVAASWTGRIGGEERSTAETGSAAVAPADASRGHVLVVDDNADLRKYMTGLLAPVYEVSTAVDGQDALDSLRKRMPDLVVSDIMMPRLDGFELVRALRDDSATAVLPVILLSAGEEAAIEGLGAGADDYLVKPFSARELLARVRTQVELARTRREWVDRLEQANRELDAFSYSVSRDLRAPLRAIEGFGRALQEDCGPQLDDVGREHVDRIRTGVRRMSTLIDALLELSRVAEAIARFSRSLW